MSHNKILKNEKTDIWKYKLISSLSKIPKDIPTEKCNICDKPCFKNVNDTDLCNNCKKKYCECCGGYLKNNCKKCDCLYGTLFIFVLCVYLLLFLY